MMTGIKTYRSNVKAFFEKEWYVEDIWVVSWAPVLAGSVSVLNTVAFGACSFVPHASLNDIPTPTLCCRALQWLSTDRL